MASKEICVISSLLILLALPVVSASSNSLSDLKSLISSFDDPHMTSNDLAFYLATHGFDASPKGDHVEVDLGDHIYKLTPRAATGLCKIAA